MSAFLASVRNAYEAGIAYRSGADWVDLKEPSMGALGAVTNDVAASIVKQLSAYPRRVKISATIGDCWDTPHSMPRKVEGRAHAGIEYAKIGLYAASPRPELVLAIKECCEIGPKIILVCFAEEPPRRVDLQTFAACGISGVMLDTAEKSGPRLVELMSRDALRQFVRDAHGANLICGLAGRLKLADIATLSRHDPDYLGFRGALCDAGVRESHISPAAAAEVRTQIDRAGRERLLNDKGQTETAENGANGG